MFVLLVVLALLGSASARAQSRSESQEVEEGRPVFVRTDTTAAPYEVRLGPNVSTHLLFDAPVELLDLDGRESFRRVSVAKDAILLLVSREAEVGTRMRMSVRLLDGGSPASVDFVLVVGPAAQAERRVEVHGPRALASCQEVGGAVEEALRCRDALAELARTCVSGGPPGLTSLLSSGGMDAVGILALPLRALTWPEKQVIMLKEATSFRANRFTADRMNPEGVRIAVELWVKSRDPRPWLAHGAELVAQDGKRHGLSVWQPEPFVIDSRRLQRVVLEAELEAEAARGTFTLELWDEGRARPVSFGGVSFP